MVVADNMVEKIERAIIAAGTGRARSATAKIFRSRVDEAIRIRNDERGDNAL
jgi:nitrogen regulatory protein P-II 1